MIEKLIFYFQYPFVIYAMITGILISLCAALLGVTLVLRRFSYIGSGLANVGFGAMAIAGILSLTNDTPIVLVVTSVCAIFLLQAGENAKVKGDASVTMVSVSALALGYLLLNIFADSSNMSADVCSTLFGSTSILTLTQSDVIFCLVLSGIVLVLFVLFYNKILAITFDESFAKATGANVKSYQLVFAVITAMIIVLAMNLVGSLLITALVIFPAVSAMRVCRSFLSVTICAGIISIVCGFIGLSASIIIGAPIGSSLVVVDMLVFGVFVVLGRLIRG